MISSLWVFSSPFAIMQVPQLLFTPGSGAATVPLALSVEAVGCCPFIHGTPEESMPGQIIPYAFLGARQRWKLLFRPLLNVKIRQLGFVL